jgi:hypothetical protein
MPTALRRCGRCGELKLADEFAWRRRTKGQRHNYCRPCSAAYHREHYLANKQRYVDNAAARRDVIALERWELLLAHFALNPCADCGENDPLVLEFDHLRDKSFNVSQGMLVYAWQTVVKEIAKCDVVCANCHRRRTASRGRFRRAAVAQLVEHEPSKLGAAGSIPVRRSD